NLTEKGHKVKKADLSWAVKDAFEAAVAAGARGMRVRFPEIGALASRDVKARKAGKGTNPFTGESIMLKARPASKKPRWSFPKAVREAYIRTAARKAADRKSTSELQSPDHLVCRLLLEKKKQITLKTAKKPSSRKKTHLPVNHPYNHQNLHRTRRDAW